MGKRLRKLVPSLVRLPESLARILRPFKHPELPKSVSFILFPYSYWWLKKQTNSATAKGLGFVCFKARRGLS